MLVLRQLLMVMLSITGSRCCNN